MTTEEILHSNLTDEQYAAVIDDSRNILCLACAGSGKSRTLAYKITFVIFPPHQYYAQATLKNGLNLPGKIA